MLVNKHDCKTASRHLKDLSIYCALNMKIKKIKINVFVRKFIFLLLEDLYYLLNAVVSYIRKVVSLIFFSLHTCIYMMLFLNKKIQLGFF